MNCRTAIPAVRHLRADGGLHFGFNDLSAYSQFCGDFCRNSDIYRLSALFTPNCICFAITIVEFNRLCFFRDGISLMRACGAAETCVGTAGVAAGEQANKTRENSTKLISVSRNLSIVLPPYSAPTNPVQDSNMREFRVSMFVRATCCCCRQRTRYRVEFFPRPLRAFFSGIHSSELYRVQDDTNGEREK